MRSCTVLCLAVIITGVFNTALMGTVNTPITNGLILALDGSDITESGGSVSSWNNQVSGSGASADFIQNTVTSQPMLVSSAINGLPALQFDGNSDYLIDSSDPAWNCDYDSDTNNAAQWTVFIVKKQATTSIQQMLLRSGYDDIQEGSGTVGYDHIWSIYCNTDTLEVHSRSSAVAYIVAKKIHALTTNKWQIIAGLYNIGTVDPSIVSFINGRQIASTDSNITRQMNGHRFTRIGSNTYSPYQYFNGLIAEVLIYKKALTVSDISQVNAYLADKYGVSDLALHCTMDNADVSRSGIKPPPALTTVDNDWTVEDVSGEGINGTATSTDSAGYVVSSESGRIRQALSFSDTTNGNRRIQFYGTSSAPVAGYNSLTVSLWMKPLSVVGTRAIAMHGNAFSSYEGWSIFQSGTVLNLRCNSGYDDYEHKAAVAFNGINTGEWYNVVMVLDRTDNRIRGYLNGSTNGVYIASSDWTDTFTSDSIEAGGNDIIIGSRGDGIEWAGYIDDFAIWQCALSADEIYSIYEKGLHGLSFTEEIIYGTIVVIK